MQPPATKVYFSCRDKERKKPGWTRRFLLMVGVEELPIIGKLLKPTLIEVSNPEGVTVGVIVRARALKVHQRWCSACPHYDAYSGYKYNSTLWHFWGGQDLKGCPRSLLKLRQAEEMGVGGWKVDRKYKKFPLREQDKLKILRNKWYIPGKGISGHDVLEEVAKCFHRHGYALAEAL